MQKLLAFALLASSGFGADARLKAVIVDGLNNHDWATATAAIRNILEGSGRFTVDVCSFPKLPEFGRYDLVIDNFNGGHLETGTPWPADAERALEAYVRGGGGLVVYHAANNAFLKWVEFNRMIGLGWRDPSFGAGIAIGPNGRVLAVPKGEGLPPGHGPRHDFEIFVLNPEHPITRGLPSHWLHPSEQLTHGQHGPAEGLTVLTYAFSEVSRQGEPMDWVRDYGKGRVYTTMLGHTWKNELNPNLDDVAFQALLSRGAEWAATGRVTLAADLGWKPRFNGKDLDGWEVRGPGVWSVMEGGVLLGQREPHTEGQAWLYTKQEFGAYDLHLEYWVPRGSNSGVSIRGRSPAHIGYEIPITDDGRKWNSMEIESRDPLIRVRINGQVVAEYPGDPPARPKVGPIGLQLRDPFAMAMFRNIRVRELR